MLAQPDRQWRKKSRFLPFSHNIFTQRFDQTGGDLGHQFIGLQLPRWPPNPGRILIFRYMRQATSMEGEQSAGCRCVDKHMAVHLSGLNPRGEYGKLP